MVDYIWVVMPRHFHTDSNVYLSAFDNENAAICQAQYENAKDFHNVWIVKRLILSQQPD